MYSKFFLVLVLVSAPLTAQHLKLCSTADWPPYEVINTQTKKVEGMSIDIATKALAKLSMTPQVTQLPWERCLAMNKTGSYDGVISVSKNADRQKFLIYPEKEMFKASYVFAVRNDAECKYCEGNTALSELPQPIGGPQGYSVVKKLKKEAAGLRIDDSATSDEINIDKLLAGRVNSIIINPDVLRALDKKKKVMHRIKLVEPAYVAGKPYYVGISKKYKGSETEAKKLAEKISSAL